ncbi:MAG: hypothetical protein KDA52_02875 [Planctomycetaceae bacterium]|nr:hypothetical protein [Planctomycetaceae bacterium]
MIKLAAFSDREVAMMVSNSAQFKGRGIQPLILKGNGPRVSRCLMTVELTAGNVIATQITPPWVRYGVA